MMAHFDPGPGWREVQYEEFEELGMLGVVAYGPAGARHWVEDATSDQPCDEEVYSWQVFSSEAVDPYWIRCDLRGPHSGHQNGETGAHWT